MRMRLQSAGADADRADWLVSLVWRRQVARYVARVAVLLLFGGLAWAGYLWMLALKGSPNGPGIGDVLFPAALIMIGGIALVISSAVEISPPLDLLLDSQISSKLSPPGSKSASPR